jgi:hypothetical protein
MVRGSQVRFQSIENTFLFEHKFTHLYHPKSNNKRHTGSVFSIFSPSFLFFYLQSLKKTSARQTRCALRRASLEADVVERSYGDRARGGAQDRWRRVVPTRVWWGTRIGGV